MSNHQRFSQFFTKHINQAIRKLNAWKYNFQLRLAISTPIQKLPSYHSLYRRPEIEKLTNFQKFKNLLSQILRNSNPHVIRMEKFTTIKSAAVPLPIEDVDTDQIIPARFLKATTREGFGDNLFRDWRYSKQPPPEVVALLNPLKGGIAILT